MGSVHTATSTHCASCGAPFRYAVRTAAALCEECILTENEEPRRHTCDACTRAHASVVRVLTGRGY